MNRYSFNVFCLSWVLVRFSLGSQSLNAWIWSRSVINLCTWCTCQIEHCVQEEMHPSAHCSPSFHVYLEHSPSPTCASASILVYRIFVFRFFHAPKFYEWPCPISLSTFCWPFHLWKILLTGHQTKLCEDTCSVHFELVWDGKWTAFSSGQCQGLKSPRSISFSICCRHILLPHHRWPRQKRPRRNGTVHLCGQGSTGCWVDSISWWGSYLHIAIRRDVGWPPFQDPQFGCQHFTNDLRVRLQLSVGLKLNSGSEIVGHPLTPCALSTGWSLWGKISTCFSGVYPTWRMRMGDRGWKHWMPISPQCVPRGCLRRATTVRRRTWGSAVALRKRVLVPP